MDVLGIFLIYLHSPSDVVRPRDCAYIIISVNPLAAMLQPINMIHVYTYTYMYVCMYVPSLLSKKFTESLKHVCHL